MTPSFIRWAASQLRPWQDRIEARQRQKRREMMLRASPTLRAAAALHDRHLRQHRATRDDVTQMRAAVTAMLRRTAR